MVCRQLHSGGNAFDDGEMNRHAAHTAAHTWGWEQVRLQRCMSWGSWALLGELWGDRISSRRVV